MGYISKSEVLVWNKDNIDDAVANCGVYILRDSSKGMLYIGVSETALRESLLQHWNDKDISDVVFFDWYETPDVKNAEDLAKTWINKYGPKNNKR